MACEVESSAPPPSPWMMRQTTRDASECALPQKNDDITNNAIEPAK